MQITTNTVVAMDYELRNDSGELLDSSESEAPLMYVQGHGSMIAGVEKELEGKTAGTEINTRITPEDGYGPHDPQLVQRVPRRIFDGIEKVEPGMQFQMNGPEGPAVVTIVELGKDDVQIDGNHPLAGQHLNFSIKIREVRAASEEELAAVRSGCSCC